MKRTVLVVGLLAGCGGSGGGAGPDASVTTPSDNPARAVTATDLAFDLAGKTATATLTLAPSETAGAGFESGDLVVTAVTDGSGAAIEFASAPTADSTPADVRSRLTLGVPASADPQTVTIAYKWADHESFTGISKDGYTFNWPYYCGNMFPCHSNPAEGTTFTLALANAPAGLVAVFPEAITQPAPAYQLAWTIGAYTELPLGTTTAGTTVSLYYRTTELAAATKGGAHLVAAFDWLEQTIGPYGFGGKVGGASVPWPDGFAGGMEHHPFWHVAAGDFSDENTQVHEAAHGWYGDGIRIGCWEDFLLSEGTVSYLAARALDVVAPSVGAASWTEYARELQGVAGTDLTWPDSCGAVDVLKDNLYTNAPYMRGAYFYRAVALKVGAGKLDAALHAFYLAHQGKSARMADMLTTIQTSTGFDPTACAQKWLRSTTIPAPETPCD